jgi:hypothetical protein
MDQEQEGRSSLRRLEVVGATAFAVTLGCLLIGQTAARYSAQVQPAPPQTAQSKPVFNAIDYATTGAVKNATVIIGPCDSRKP